MSSLRFALRTLFKAPFVTAVAIVSLALGIGANAAIFSLFNEALLRPLPVDHAEQLVNLGAPGPKPGSNDCGMPGDCSEVFSYPMFRDLEREQKVLSGLAAHVFFEANLAFGGQTGSGTGALVSGSYFQVLGLRPAAGRLLGPEDDGTLGEPHVAVLAHAYWHSRFGADAFVVGRQMVINGQSMTIVGIAPEGFEGTTLFAEPKVFVPITMRGAMQPSFNGFENRRSYWAYLFGRLKPGVTIERARAALNVPYRAMLNDVEAPQQKGMSETTLAKFKARALTIEPGPSGQSSARKEVGAPLTLLLCVTGVVLLIACANIANLLLARSAGRSGEMAVRLALGAGRGQLVRQLLLESCLLGIFGAAAGVCVSWWTLGAIEGMMPSELGGGLQSAAIDPQVLLFTAALGLGTALAFGLFPALHGTRPDLVSSLKDAARQSAGARSAVLFRKGLVVVQIALSMALLASAGLFTRSLLNVSRVDLGINVQSLVTFAVAPGLSGYTPERTQALFDQLEAKIAAVPGVTGVTASVLPLLAGDSWGTGVSVEGYPSGPDTDLNSRYDEVSPGFFKTMGIQMLAGREFTRADSAGARKVAIVNEAFAAKFKLGREAVGKLMARVGSRADRPKLDVEIVGLVQNAKYDEVKAVVPPVFYVPQAQGDHLSESTFYVRVAGDPSAALTAIPGVVAALDANLPVTNLRTMPQQVRESVFQDRLISTLSASFAGLATVLAAVGLYGVLAYTVAQRTREFGLRMALGAAPGRVRALVLRQVAWMTVVGGIIGATLAIGIGSLAGSLLFEIRAADPAVLALAVAALGIVALLAGLIPALRASRIHPMAALRHD